MIAHARKCDNEGDHRSDGKCPDYGERNRHDLSAPSLGLAADVL